MEKTQIICIDDDEALLAAVTRALRREPDLEVRSTTDPHEALAWIRDEDIAVLVSDYEMPEMTGAQLAGRAKMLRPETVRILLTGKRTLETAIDGINQGEIFRYVAKPFVDKQLREAVREGVARHVELKGLLGDRDRRQRREAIRKALEAEHPGISQVEATGPVIVTDDPWSEAEAVGWVGVLIALGPR